MPEVPGAGEHHREAGLVGGLDDLVVAHRAAGLDHRRRASLGCRQQPVREREERIRRDDGAFRETLRAGRLPSAASAAFQAAMREESTRLIWPAPMPTVAPSFA